MDALEERTVTLHSGVTLPYAETGGPGGSIPMVLVHGYVESWRYFEPVVRSLPPSIHAFVPTQRGHQSVDVHGLRVPAATPTNDPPITT